ncbi:hypothetical protein GCM10011579_095490 [Streptomyces albiflavescens]|uniref:Uncharacterized protein n=1 Tax=Streptomyces albiflavescens TaxID=1623582 RepID=A0A917YH25_9ACTN|nr:hypothetical protein GCM10011579_095490 [Streptomyces albiflavescens]
MDRGRGHDVPTAACDREDGSRIYRGKSGGGERRADGHCGGRQLLKDQLGFALKRSAAGGDKLPPPAAGQVRPALSPSTWSILVLWEHEPSASRPWARPCKDRC